MPENKDGKIALWDRQKMVPSKHLKDADNGKYKFTSIAPQYLLQQGTLEWGPYGHAWGLRQMQFEPTQIGGKDTLILHAVFFYPVDGTQVEFEISVDMPYRWNDDAFKKIQTAALSKALSRCGFGADIYMDYHSLPDYRSDLAFAAQPDEAKRKKMITSIEAAKSVAQLEKIMSRIEARRELLGKELHAEGMQMIEEKKRAIAAPKLVDDLPLSADERESVRKQELRENSGGLFR